MVLANLFFISLIHTVLFHYSEIWSGTCHTGLMLVLVITCPWRLRRMILCSHKD